ncbi:MAG: lipopolysaccharide biosynthesis [Pseudomonadota bacterium]
MASDLKFYGKLLIRRFPAMAALFLLASCVGIIIALRLPTLYETRATLLVESAQISNVPSAIQASAAEQLEVIQQRLMTRANLLEIARSNRIFPDIASMTPDEIVQGMREQTNIRRVAGRNKATSMTIRFRAARPQQAAAVVNQYVTIVLATNSELRTSSAQGNLDFFQQEVDRLSEDLSVQNQKIVEFKQANRNALPENLTYRLNRQSLLQERVTRAERDLEAQQAQRTNMLRVFEATGTMQAAQDVPLTPEQQELRRLETDLRTALSIYSEENPRVRLLRARVQTLRDNIEAQMTAVSATEPSEEQTNQQVSVLQLNLAEIDTRIEALRREITTAEEELRTLDSSIEATPTNRIMLEQMERESDNIQRLYSAAVQRLNQAQISVSVVTSAKGERISVLEPPSVPDSPASPNRAAIAGLGVAVGIGLAAGLFLLLEVLNQSIRRPVDITSGLNITPLATLPRLETEAHRRWRRVVQIATLVVVIVAVPASLWAIDTYYMPLDLLFERIRDRLI